MIAVALALALMPLDPLPGPDPGFTIGAGEWEVCPALTGADRGLRMSATDTAPAATIFTDVTRQLTVTTERLTAGRVYSVSAPVRCAIDTLTSVRSVEYRPGLIGYLDAAQFTAAPRPSTTPSPAATTGADAASDTDQGARLIGVESLAALAIVLSLFWTGRRRVKRPAGDQPRA